MIEKSVREIRALMTDESLPPVDPPIDPPPPPPILPGRDNQAVTYGVGILPVHASPLWVAKRVRHLSPAENRGKRNVYIDALRPDGSKDTNPSLRAVWTWNGRRPSEPAPPIALDKGAGEPMGNIPLYAGQVMSVRIEGDGVLSDVVYGISSDHPDEGDGNTRFHHSFHVVFQRSQ